jgi:hypothetical protein
MNMQLNDEGQECNTGHEGREMKRVKEVKMVEVPPVHI